MAKPSIITQFQVVSITLALAENADIRYFAEFFSCDLWLIKGNYGCFKERDRNNKSRLKTFQVWDVYR